MTVALDDKGTRISPFRKGRGKCQICEDEVIAHCGEIYAWHWKHRSDRECDPWKEHETEWHRQWKARFPLECQEVVVINDLGEKHIADVKLSNGIVIEFQNSSISTRTIKEREEFYEDMIWVINAKSFRDNLQISSAVKRNLKKIDKNYIDDIVFAKSEVENRIKNLQIEIDKQERVIESKSRIIKDLLDKRENLTKLLNSVAEVTDKVVEFWKGIWFTFSINSLASDVDSNLKKQFVDADKEILSLKNELSKLKADKLFIQNKPDIEFENKLLKIISYHELNKSNYHKATIIKQQSINSFFKEGSKIKNDLDLFNLQYQLNYFTIAFDMTDALTTIQSKIQSASQNIEEKELLMSSIKPLILKELEVLLSGKIATLDSDIEIKENELDALIQAVEEPRYKVGLLENRKDDDIKASENELLEQKNAQRSNIMTRNKGMYYFNWKHERTTWQYANESIFFDMGDGFLFRKTGEGVFHKYSLEEFLKAYGEHRAQLYVQP